jgi:glucokinase
MAVWAADIGGTGIKLAIVDRGEIVLSREIASVPADGLRRAMNRIAPVWRELCRQSAIPESAITAIGIAIPAIVAPDSGKIWTVPGGKFADAPTFKMGQWVERTFHKPAYWCNDAHAALAGELKHGMARGIKNVVMMTLGTGVGTAVVLNARHLTGPHGLAGNAGGHNTINFRGAPCGCGNIGCVETQASSWALPDRAAASPLFATSALAREATIHYEAVFRLAKKGDALARQLQAQSLTAWAITATTLIHSYDPDLLIIGGKIADRADVIVPFIRQFIRTHCWAKWNVRIAAAALGNNAGLLGIASLAAKPRPRSKS